MIKPLLFRLRPGPRLVTIWLLTAAAFSAAAAPAFAAPVIWTFDTTLRVACVEDGTVCPAEIQPYVSLQDAPVHGILIFDSGAMDLNSNPTIGVYSLTRWTLEVPTFDTTWIAPTGTIEVGTVEAPTLGAFPCFGCMAAFGFFSGNSNPAAPMAPGGNLPFEFRTFGPQYTTDALPSGLRSFQTNGGFFVGASQITARPFVVHAVPEPASALLLASGLGCVLMRRGGRFRRRVSPGAGRAIGSP